MTKISERDKMILIILALFIFIFVSFMFVFQPVRAQLNALETKLKDVNQKTLEAQAKRETLNNFNSFEKQKYEVLESSLDELFPTDVLQEDVIMRMKEITAKLPGGSSSVKVSTLGFAQSNKQSDTQDSTAGSATVASYISGLAQAETIKLSFETKGAILKEMLKNIVNSKPKFVVSDMSITYSDKPGAKDPILKVAMSLNVITYKSEGNRLNNEVNFRKYTPHGESKKQNIFTPLDGLGSTPFLLGNDDKTSAANYNGTGLVESQNDFYVTVSPVKLDGPTAELGISNDGSKTINQDKDGVANINFTFEKKNGVYYYSYSTDTMKYPVNGGMEKFSPKLAQGIVVSATANRLKESTDKVGANININNKTDIPVAVVIEKDDPNNQKIVVNKVFGDITEIRK